MRVSWLLMAVMVVVVAAAGVFASPLDTTEPEEGSSGWKTLHAVKSFFQPMTDYFVKDLPSKTPSDVAQDVQEKVTDVKEWAQESEAIQGLVSSLAPVRNWLQEKANTLKDKSFQDMYDDVKEKVSTLDDRVATWIQERNSK